MTDVNMANRMKKNVWTVSFPVSSFLVNAEKELSLHGLISFIQEMAWSHAGHLGFGYSEIRDRGDSWVIARQRIEIEEWPRWEETVTVTTWLRPPGAVIVSRDFEFFVGEKRFGRATAHWLTINHQPRRPTRLPFPDDPSLFKQTGHLEIEPDKLRPDPSLKDLNTYQVRYSDLDMNSHVNNTRFAQWILDTLPLAVHSKFQLTGYQINFLAEARTGDGVVVKGPNLSTMPTELAFQGHRESDGELLFLARLKGKPRI